jgi:hypothetical protein
MVRLIAASNSAGGEGAASGGGYQGGGNSGGGYQGGGNSAGGGYQGNSGGNKDFTPVKKPARRFKKPE